MEEEEQYSQAFSKLIFGGDEKITKIIQSINPTWDESFIFPVNIPNENVLEIYFYK